MIEHAGDSFLSMILFSASWLIAYTLYKIHDRINARHNPPPDN